MLEGMIEPDKDKKPAAAPSRGAPEHIPTGTFRKNSDDGWDDLNFGGDNTGGVDSNRGIGFSKPSGRFAAKK